MADVQLIDFFQIHAKKAAAAAIITAPLHIAAKTAALKLGAAKAKVAAVGAVVHTLKKNPIHVPVPLPIPVPVPIAPVVVPIVKPVPIIKPVPIVVPKPIIAPAAGPDVSSLISDGVGHVLSTLVGR